MDFNPYILSKGIMKSTLLKGGVIEEGKPNKENRRGGTFVSL